MTMSRLRIVSARGTLLELAPDDLGGFVVEWLAGSSGSWATVEVDLSEPIEPIPMGGANLLRVTAFFKDRPLGSIELPAPLDPFPASYLADALSRHFGSELHRLLIGATQDPEVTATPRTSVVVCTRDRQSSLRRCLESLSGLDPPATEIIVVDNGTDPSTVETIVGEFGARYVREALPGLDRARNRGVSEATGEIVLFTDDDVEVTPGWAGRLAACFDDPLVMAASGMVLAASLDPSARARSEMYASHSRGVRKRVVDGTDVPPVVAGSLGAGSSMSFRTAFIRSLGGFPDELDAGMPTATGGDTYALYRVLKAGYRVVYEPRAVARHWHRDTDTELERMVRGNGTGLASYLIHLGVAESDREAKFGLLGVSRYLIGRAIRSVRPKRIAPPRLVIQEILGALGAFAAYRASRKITRSRGTVSPGIAEMPTPWLDEVEVSNGHHPSSELPKVSVIIPTRGRRDLVCRLLRTLDSCTYPREKLEVIVCIDGDIDGTKAGINQQVLGLKPRVLVLDSEMGANGPAVTRNEGAQAATGDILLFLDDDLAPRTENFLIDHVSAHLGGAQAVSGPCWVDLRHADRYLAQALRNWWVDHNTLLIAQEGTSFTGLSSGNFSIDSEVFGEIGGFVRMPRREDWRLGYDLLRRGHDFRVVGTAAVLQELELDLRTHLQDRRLEGASDFMWSMETPEVLLHLPLASWFDKKRSRTLVRVLIDRPALGDRMIDLGERLAPFLEGIGWRRQYMKLLQYLNSVSYWSGVGGACSGLDQWLALISTVHAIPNLESPIADISDRTAWSSDLLAGSGYIEIIHKGRTLGLAPRRWGGLTWDSDRFHSKIVDHFGDAALKASVMEQL